MKSEIYISGLFWEKTVIQHKFPKFDNRITINAFKFDFGNQFTVILRCITVSPKTVILTKITLFVEKLRF